MQGRKPHEEQGRRDGAVPSTDAGRGRDAGREGDAPAPDDTAALIESASQIVAGSDTARPASTVLPGVLSEVPAAILLIDVADGTVTYANRAAIALADHPLPVALDRWGSLAGLTDLERQPLASSAHPLSRLVTGSPVAGEAVLLPSGADRPDRLLWVTGFPLSDALDVEQLALVVLLEVDASATEAESALAALRDRALIATDLAFTITHPGEDDNPLAWVNPAFTKVTGYTQDEVVGRNCRFLQGPATDRAEVDRLREAIDNKVPITLTLLNYRKDGTAFWNQLSVSPVFDRDDRLVSYVGVQADVTERVRSESERERAYAAERVARQEVEQARQRLAMLAEASTQLAATLDTDETLERLADIAVPGLADWVVIALADPQGQMTRVMLRHRSGREALLSRYGELMPVSMTERSGTRRVLAGGEPILIHDTSQSDWHSHVSSEEMTRIVGELGLASVMYVPLMARRRQILGTITLVTGPSGRHYTEEDLAVAADLGRRAGLTLDNARLYQHEHWAAETLQRGLLPEVPKVDGLELAVRYRPGDVSAEVGGDFYDLLELPDGSYGVATGDVVGHDMAAAASMGHLRGLLRAVAWTRSDEGRSDPGEVLERVDRLMQGLDVGAMSSVLYGRLERPARADGPWRYTYASAGHPPALLCGDGAAVQVLDGGRSVLLGVGTGGSRPTASIEVPVGSTLVAYTDGLIERRGEDLDVGLARIAGALSEVCGADVEGVADTLVEAAGDDRDDDIAIIVVRTLPPGSVGD